MKTWEEACETVGMITTSLLCITDRLAFVNVYRPMTFKTHEYDRPIASYGALIPATAPLLNLIAELDLTDWLPARVAKANVPFDFFNVTGQKKPEVDSNKLVTLKGELDMLTVRNLPWDNVFYDKECTLHMRLYVVEAPHIGRRIRFSLEKIKVML